MWGGGGGEESGSACVGSVAVCLCGALVWGVWQCVCGGVAVQVCVWGVWQWVCCALVCGSVCVCGACLSAVQADMHVCQCQWV